MRVAVIGAGLAGVATALELVAQGHQVDVIERAGGIATAASFAPPAWLPQALLAAGHPSWGQTDDLTPWQARWLGAGRALAHPGRATWSWQRLQAARLGQTSMRRELALALAQRSSRRLRSLAKAWDWRQEGTVGAAILLPDKPSQARAEAWATRLQAAGLAWRRLDSQDLAAAMPALQLPSAGIEALLLPDEDVVNGREAAHLLKAEAQRLGARFHFDVALTALEPGPRLQLSHPLEDPACDAWDAVVLCQGAQGPAWLQRMGLRLPWQTIGSATVTAPLPTHLAETTLPALALLDASSGVQVARIGERLRVSGPGLPRDPAPPSLQRKQWALLYRTLDRWLPGVARTAKAQEWWSSRAVLPDGLPLVGRLPGSPASSSGIWFNLGHGESSWTWVLGSALALVAQMPAPGPRPWVVPATEAPMPDALISLLGPARWGSLLR